VGRFILPIGLALAAASASPASAVTFPGPGHIYLCSSCTTYPYATTATVIEAFSAPAKSVGNISGIKTGSGFTEFFTPQNNHTERLSIKNNAVSGMTGQYLQIDNGGSTYKITFDTAVQFFSFAFNGLDTSARVILTFNDAAHTQITLMGRNILGLSANSAIPTFGRVTYDFAGGVGLKAIQFIAGNNSLRLDSIASAAPEPATWGMMILGFGLAGAQLRSRKRKVKIAVA
jgi:hypothetical protein